MLIYFHLGSFWSFKHYYLFYMCKHLCHDFPSLVPYNRFVELEAKVAVPMTRFLKNQ